ncbi:MAG: hypothetical protein ACJ8D3_11500 [Sphingomicrobium sp.]
MTRLTIAAAIALLAAAPLLAQQSDTVEATDPNAARIVADCSARKFESSIEIDKGGQKRLTRFKLCAAKDSDDAAWVKVLQDAKAKIAAHPDISAESKVSIASQLDVEIAKYSKAGQAPQAAVTIQQTPNIAATTQTAPLPAPVAKLTPLPAPAAMSAAAKPRITIRCLEPGETGAGSTCTSLGRATRLQVRADAELGQGTTLRFLRRGDVRGEIALAQMHQGDLYRSKLPPELCAGVASSKVEIQILGGKQVVDTLGPYNLRC